METIQKFIPKKYAVFPLALTAVLYLCVYYISALVCRNFPTHDPATVIDGMIPFFTPSVLIYVLAYPQWILCLLYLSTADKENCYRSFTAAICALLISLLIFIVFPTSTVRPEITGNGFFDGLLRLIYSFDSPCTLLPSFHCIASWFSFRTVARDVRTPAWANAVNLIFTLLVFASTLLTKQHVFFDVPSALLVMEAGSFLSRELSFSKIFDSVLKK
ncbi:MAG: hypothetical protein MJ102_07385 [Clostridia bacterium]|nr:hypothetical protein [Clostridia bacterium]